MSNKNNKNIIFAIEDLNYDKNVKKENEYENALELYENYENDPVIDKYFYKNIYDEFSSDINNFYSKEERNINESTTLNYDYYNISNNNNDIEKKNKNKRITKDSTNLNTICKEENENIDNDCAFIMNHNDTNNLENSLIFLNNDNQKNDNQEDFY